MSERSKIKRLRDRARYDRASFNAVLQSSFVCHVGIAVGDQPFVIPMAFAPDGEDLLLHGPALSRLCKTLAKSVPACVTVTHLDGLVLARSHFNHSMNYRSAVAFGRARAIEDDGEKKRALVVFVDWMIPGRAGEARAPSREELRATTVLRFSIEEFSVKRRSGPPLDASQDYACNLWAGVIPFHVTAGVPQQDPTQDSSVSLPAHVGELCARHSMFAPGILQRPADARDDSSS